MSNFDTSKVKTNIVYITPEQADNWLKHTNTRNRNASNATVDAYARDMREGSWELTSQGISFYENNVLADGQHRLMAIVRSGKTIPMLVTTGLPQSAINGIDQHKIRRVNDVLTLKQDYGDVTTVDVATLRLCYSYVKSGVTLVESMLRENTNELNLINKVFGRSSNNPVSSAIFRAATLMALKSGVPEDKICEFYRVLSTGMAEKPEHAIIISLRDAAMKGDFKKGGDSVRRVYVRRVQKAMQKFVAGEVMSRIVTPERNIYPYLELGGDDHE